MQYRVEVTIGDDTYYVVDDDNGLNITTDEDKATTFGWFKLSDVINCVFTEYDNITNIEIGAV